MSCRDVIGGYRIQLSFKMMKVVFWTKKNLLRFFAEFGPNCPIFLLLGWLVIFISLGDSFSISLCFCWEISVFEKRIQLEGMSLWLLGEKRCSAPTTARTIGPLEAPSGGKGPDNQHPQDGFKYFLIIDSESLSKLAVLDFQTHSKHWGLILCFN